MNTPVLFLVFNRPDTTARVFNAIREARPSRLYVAADGPRAAHPMDRELCESARRIGTGIDWPCELKTLFREHNLGLGAAVTGAIDWFFANESEGIILEDDCLPDPSFFPFCEELLEHYRDAQEVMMISGDYYGGHQDRTRESYFFSRLIGIWGWATWKRAWNLHDKTMHRWPELRGSGWLGRIGDGHQDFIAYWTRVFDSVCAGRADTWAYQWGFSFWSQGGLCIVPSRNLVRHIGHGVDATHGGGGWLGHVPLESMTFPLVHPGRIERDVVADRWMDLNVFGTKAERYRRWLRRIPGLRWAVRRLRSLRSNDNA